MAGAPTTPEQSREFAIRSATNQKAGLSAEQQAFINEVRQKAEKDPRSAAERMKQGRENQPKTIPQPEVDLVIKNNTKETGTTINGVNIETRSKTVNKYIETGVIDPAERNTILTEIRTQLSKDPDIEAMMSSFRPPLTTREQETFLNNMINPLLKDPRGKEIVSQIFTQTMDKTKVLSRQNLQESKKTADDAAIEAANLDSQLTQVRSDLRTKQARLKQFSDGSGRTPKGALFTELEGLRNALPENRNKLATNQRQQQSLNNYIKSLENTRAAILGGRMSGDLNAIITELETQDGILTTLEGDGMTLKKAIDRTQELEDESNQLKQQVPDLQAQERELDKRYDSLYEIARNKNDEFNSSENMQKNSEEGFKREVTEVFSQAVRRLLEEKVEKHEEIQEQEIEELKKTATTDDERKILDAYMNRWASGKIKGRGPFGAKGFFGQTEVTILNREQTLSDFKKLFVEITNSDGTKGHNLNPDAIRDLVGAIVLNREPHAFTQDDITRINKLLESDNFKNNIQPQMLEGLIARQMQANPKGLTPREAELILNAPWGDKVIDNALQKNPAAKAKIDALRAQGAITGTTTEWIKKHKGQTALMILLGIIGATGAAILAGPAIVGAAGAGISGGASLYTRVFGQ